MASLRTLAGLERRVMAVFCSPWLLPGTCRRAMLARREHHTAHANQFTAELVTNPLSNPGPDPGKRTGGVPPRFASSNPHAGTFSGPAVSSQKPKSP